MTLLVSGINLYAMALVLHTFLGWHWDVSMWVSAGHRGRLRLALRPDSRRSSPRSSSSSSSGSGCSWCRFSASSRSAACSEVFARVPDGFATLWSTSADPTAERHDDHLGRYRPGPRLRALVRLLDHRLPRGAARLLGQGPARRAHDPDHRLVLQDGGAVPGHHRGTDRADARAATRQRLRAAVRTAARSTTTPPCRC